MISYTIFLKSLGGISSSIPHLKFWRGPSPLFPLSLRSWRQVCVLHKILWMSVLGISLHLSSSFACLCLTLPPLLQMALMDISYFKSKHSWSFLLIFCWRFLFWNKDFLQSLFRVVLGSVRNFDLFKKHFIGSLRYWFIKITDLL